MADRIEHTDGVALQTWINDNYLDNKDENGQLIYGRAGLDQAMFVRDKLNSLFHDSYETWKDTPVRVVGQHTSKSVPMPVYSMIGYGAEVRLRGNFFNWVVSVKAPYILTDTFGSADERFALFQRDHEVHDCYAEGFTKDWVFGSFAAALEKEYNRYSRTTFTVSIGYDSSRLWAFLWMLTNQMRESEIHGGE